MKKKPVDFTYIRYANCWEDADLLLANTTPSPKATIASIASAGDNSLAFLASDPALVIAFDINPETGKLTEVFKTPGQYQQIVGITDNAAYYLNNGVNSQGNPNEIIKHDFATKKETVIATTGLKSSYIVSSKLSPDNKRMAYAEVCQTKCSDQDNEKVTTIKQINLVDNSIKTLYNKKIYDNSFPFGISGWENLDYLKLFGYCECDGEVSANSTKVLNVNSGDITEINLTENRVSYVSLSPDSKKIAYVYFSGAYENPKFTSGFKIKDLETGKIETIVESSKEAYESVKWVNDNQLALFTIKVTSVDAGLGVEGYPSGPRAISLFNYSDANKELKNATDYAEYMLLDKVTENYIFYTIITNSKPSQTPTNHSLNLKTGKVTKLIIPANHQLDF